MALVIDDPETDRLAREVAALRGIGQAEAVRVALERELRRDERPGLGDLPGRELGERMGPIWESVEALGNRSRGRPADKAFHDDLSGS